MTPMDVWRALDVAEIKRWIDTLVAFSGGCFFRIDCGSRDFPFYYANEKEEIFRRRPVGNKFRRLVRRRFAIFGAVVYFQRHGAIVIGLINESVPVQVASMFFDFIGRVRDGKGKCRRDVFDGRRKRLACLSPIKNLEPCRCQLSKKRSKTCSVLLLERIKSNL